MSTVVGQAAAEERRHPVVEQQVHGASSPGSRPARADAGSRGSPPSSDSWWLTWNDTKTGRRLRVEREVPVDPEPAVHVPAEGQHPGALGHRVEAGGVPVHRQHAHVGVDAPESVLRTIPAPAAARSPRRARRGSGHLGAARHGRCSPASARSRRRWPTPGAGRAACSRAPRTRPVPRGPARAPGRNARGRPRSPATLASSRTASGSASPLVPGSDEGAAAPGRRGPPRRDRTQSGRAPARCRPAAPSSGASSCSAVTTATAGSVANSTATSSAGDQGQGVGPGARP